MTDDQAASAQSDLAALRSIALAGRRTPLVGGAILVSAGIIFGLANLVSWLAVEHRIGLTPRALAWLWPAALGLFVLTLGAALLGLRDSINAPVEANRVVRASWRAIGIGMTTLFIAAYAAGIASRDPMAWALISPAVFVLYGVGWSTAAAAAQASWLRWIAYGCYVCALIVGATAAVSTHFLIAAVATVFLVGWPGGHLLRLERRNAS